MGKTTELRQEIKRRVYPLLAEKGFSLDLRDAPGSVTFRRVTAAAVHVLDIQFEKYGRRRFVVNFGMCGPAGVVCWGERISPADVFPGQALRNGRLTPRRQGGTATWFRQDRSLLARLLSQPRRSASEVVSELLALLPEVEAFFEDGAVAAHLSVNPVGNWVRDASEVIAS